MQTPVDPPPSGPDLNRMRRLAVIGNAGGGKSTLAGNLGRMLDLPVHSLDGIKWGPGWVPVPAAEVERRCREWIAGENWIIDGFGTWEFIESEFARADTIVLLDLPLPVHYWWAIKRQFRDLFRPRPDLPANCPMIRMTVPLLKTIWFTHKLARPKLLQLAVAEKPRRQVLHLRSPGEIRDLLRRVGGLAAARQHHASGRAAAPASNDAPDAR